MKIKSTDRTIFAIISYSMISIFAIACLLPFVMMVSGSLSNQREVLIFGYTLWPRDFTIIAYRALFAAPEVMLNSFFISVVVTVGGTALNIFVTSMAAYVLGRKEFRPRNQVAFIYYFTMLFNGGLVPYYLLMVTVYNLQNTLWALILPGAANVWNILILRSFMKNNIPDSLVESAKMDGAGEFTIYRCVVLPLMIPSLMAVGFFTAIGYWNDWFSAMLFIDNESLVPLQYHLYRMLNTINALAQIAARSPHTNIPPVDLPGETVKLAMAAVAAAPIIFLFAFIQKHFVKGITIGAVKG